jgi:hypothetical protein
MKEKKKKEEDISSETPREKRSPKSGRLSGMIESMQKRGSPLNAHRVATRYFDSFRKERHIPVDDESAADIVLAPEKEPDTELITAVDSAVKTKEKRKPAAADIGSKLADLKDLEEGFTPSELKVYGAIYKKSMEKKAPTLRLGLKELRELTGLSDKTVRVAIHSLEEKLSLRVVEPSLGVYGRKFYVPGPGEVLRERRKAGLEIDPTTKKMAVSSSPVITAVESGINTALSNAVGNAVVTTVIDSPVSSGEMLDQILSLYEFYTGNERTDEDEKYFESIEHLDVRVIEAALILTGLKGKGGVAGFSQIGGVLADFEEEPPEGYIEHLREAWKALRGGE